VTRIERPQDRRARVWAVLVSVFGLPAWGELLATNRYTSPALVVGCL